jgi:hypothetical protein
MITVRLTGGLGNQLFQYAAGLSLARLHGTTVQLDLATLPLDGRPFRLDEFTIEPVRVRSPQIEAIQPGLSGRIGRSLRTRWNRIAGAIDEKRPWYRRTPVVQPHHHFAPEFFKIRDGAELKGYWQSPKYFEKIEAEIRSQYRFKDPLPPDLEAQLERLSRPDSVALHVRRGDYVSNPIFAKRYRLMGLEYYSRALDWMRSELGSINVFVFSDDPKWCAEHLSRLGSFEFGSGRSDMEDFKLLSGSSHQIMSNSTFAWWGAYLAKHPGQKVVAPSDWYFMDYRLEDQFPAGWKLIEP